MLSRDYMESMIDTLDELSMAQRPIAVSEPLVTCVLACTNLSAGDVREQGSWPPCGLCTMEGSGQTVWGAARGTRLTTHPWSLRNPPQEIITNATAGLPAGAGPLLVMGRPINATVDRVFRALNATRRALGATSEINDQVEEWQVGGGVAGSFSIFAGLGLGGGA